MEPDAHRIARNESLRRDVNEAIDEGRRDRSGTVGFVCECGRIGCTAILELPIDDYEAVRDHPRRFLVAHGHEQTEVEVVLERRPGHAVVEKLDEAGEIAERADPRS